MMPVAHISPNPNQPRRHFDDAALDELAASIAARGLIQPIVVRPHPNPRAAAPIRSSPASAAGERPSARSCTRFLSSCANCRMPIRSSSQSLRTSSDRISTRSKKLYLIKGLIEDFGHTQEALGKLVGKSRSHVANMLRLLELPGPVRDMVADGRLSMGHARALITAPNAEALADEVVAPRPVGPRDREARARRQGRSKTRPASARRRDRSTPISARSSGSLATFSG